MIKSNTSHIGFEDTKCPMGVEAVLSDPPPSHRPCVLPVGGIGFAGNQDERLDKISMNLNSVSISLFVLRSRTFPRINTSQCPAKPIPLTAGATAAGAQSVETKLRTIAEQSASMLVPEII